MKSIIKVILWDFGGVLTNSPIQNFYKYEKKNNILPGTLININNHNKYNNAWARLEKNEIDKEEFAKLFLKESKELKIKDKLDIEKILECLDVELNHEMVEVFLKYKNKIPCACLTNNIPENINNKASITFKKFKKNFSHVFESSKIGLRKPEEKIYKYVIEKLNVRPENILFMDDLGVNLKPARTLGFKTYKVVNTKDTKIFLKNFLES